MQAFFISSLGYAWVTQEGKQEDVHPQADVSNLIKKPEFCGNKNVGILLHSWGIFTKQLKRFQHGERPGNIPPRLNPK